MLDAFYWAPLLDSLVSIASKCLLQLHPSNTIVCFFGCLDVWLLVFWDFWAVWFFGCLGGLAVWFFGFLEVWRSLFLDIRAKQ